MGKQVGCCGNFTRFLLGVFSLMFLLIGIALVVLTSLIKWSNVFSSVINTNQLNNVLNLVTLDAITIALLVLGSFTIVLSLIGLIGVIFLNKCLLIFYEIICVLLFLAHAAAFIAYFVYAPQLNTQIQKSFNQTISSNSSDTNQIGLLYGVSKVFSCCGSNGPSDFSGTGKNVSLYCFNTTASLGCSTAVNNFIQKYSIYGIVIPTAILLFIEFIIIVGTPILIQRVNSSFD
jgi:hypothetical protein